MPGPPPVREAERRRRNEPPRPITHLGPDDFTRLGIDTSPQPPDPERLQPNDSPEDLETPEGRRTVADTNGWHPFATELYERLQRDPSAKWNGPAAQAMDMIMCEALSRLLLPRLAGMVPGTTTTPGSPIYDFVAMNGAEMAAVLKWASARGLYEGDRLRIGKEIEFFKDVDNREPATVTQITQNREDIFASAAGE